MDATERPHTAVYIEPGGDMWGRLRHWLHESISAIEAGDLSRLPQELAQDGGQAARDTYETVLMAMEILEKGYLEQKSQDIHPRRGLDSLAR